MGSYLRDELSGEGLLRMRVFLQNRQIMVSVAVLAVPLLLGACAMDIPEFKTPSFVKKGFNAINPLAEETEENSPPAGKHEPSPAELVDANGACLAPGTDSATPPAPTGLALQMSECGLVQLLGPPEKVDIGANELGDRTAVISFSRGQRPGIYRFTDGQLKAIERIAEPAAPPKSQKPAKPVKQAPLRRTAT
jgi:hypothetical protein